MTLTAQQMIDRCVDGDRPSINEIADAFCDTIFWNCSDRLPSGLDDESRIECELPLTVSDSGMDEEGEVHHVLRFEMGECCIRVATVHQTRSDDSAREEDAHFIANLPVFIPALFRAIYELHAENAGLRSEVATANLALAGIPDPAAIVELVAAGRTIAQRVQVFAHYSSDPNFLRELDAFNAALSPFLTDAEVKRDLDEAGIDMDEPKQRLREMIKDAKLPNHKGE